MGFWGRRAWLVVAALLGIGLSSIQPALADCQPTIQTPNTVVTCTGSVPTGFAATADLLTINILAGAVINDDGTAGLTLGQSNIVNNFGSIITGPATTGILSSGGNFNVISNFGTIIGGDDGTAVSFGSNNRLTNSGFITGGINSLLISGDSNNVVINSGTMTANGAGIFFANGNDIRNSGTMNVIGGGTLIQLDSNNTFTNTGRINIDCCGLGVFANGLNTITNSGSIVLGFNAIAIQVIDNNTVINNGSIVGPDNGTAIIAGDNNIITNNGSIVIGGSSLFAIQVANSNTITNNGSIVIGPGAGGLFVSDNSTVTNNGSISVGAFGVAIFSPSSTNVVLTNNGTIDGVVFLGSCGCAGTNVLTNNGLLTVNDPGTPVGAGGIVVGGTFTQSATGTLALRVAPGTNVNDFAAVDVANLGGTLRVVVTPGLYDPVTSYVMATTTTALATQFATVTTSPFFDIATTYNPNDVTITMTRRSFGSPRGGTINQQAVGTALETQFSLGATGDAATIFGNVAASSTATVLDLLSGEAAAAAQNAGFATGGQFLSMMLRQAGVARSGATGGGFARAQDGQRVQLASSPTLADAAPAQSRAGAAGPWSMWMAGFGGYAGRDGDAAAGSARQSIGFAGVATGVDYRVSPSLLIGAAAAASGAGYTVSDRASEGDSRNFHVGIYGGFASGALYVDGALSYAYGDFTNTRIIAVGTAERANGAFTGHQFGGRLESGWRMKVSSYEMTPFAAMGVQSLRQSGYSETSRVIATGAPGIMGLNVASQRTWSVRSELGGQVNTTFALDGGTTIKPRLRLAWAHEFSADRQVTASLQSLPTASFTVNGARAARDAALVTAGVDIGLSSNVTGFAQLDGEFSLSGSSVAGAAGLRVTW